MMDVQNFDSPALRALCEEFEVERLELFGSGAEGTTGNDIDLIVTYRPGARLGPWLSRFFELRDRLQRLFGRPVDLIMSKAIRRPHFRASVDRQRRALYAA
jgi:uncharacterized protein